MVFAFFEVFHYLVEAEVFVSHVSFGYAFDFGVFVACDDLGYESVPFADEVCGYVSDGVSL